MFPQRSRPLKRYVAERPETLDSPRAACLDDSLARRASPLKTFGRWTLSIVLIHPAGVVAGAQLPTSSAALRPLLGCAAWSRLRTTRQDACVSTCPVSDMSSLKLFRPRSRELRACLSRLTTPASRTRVPTAGAVAPLDAFGNASFQLMLPVWTTGNPQLAAAC